MRSNARRLVGLGRSHDAEPFLKKSQTFSESNIPHPSAYPHACEIKKRGLLVIECIPYALLLSTATFSFLLKFNVRCIRDFHYVCVHFV